MERVDIAHSAEIIDAVSSRSVGGRQPSETRDIEQLRQRQIPLLVPASATLADLAYVGVGGQPSAATAAALPAVNDDLLYRLPVTANGYAVTVSNYNTSSTGTSEDIATQRTFVTYPVAANNPAMEPAGYEGSTAGYMPQPHDDTTALEKAVPADKLRAMLQAQLEYYFSAENLNRDKYLLTQMDRDQWVPIAIVAGFNQVRKMTNRLELVVDVLRGSALVEVDEAGIHVRPANKRCTVILREIPQDTRVEDVEALFRGDGCPPFLDCVFAHNDSWYVTFSNEEEAHRAFFYLRETVRTFQGRPIMARMKARPPLAVATPSSQPSVAAAAATASAVSAPMSVPTTPVVTSSFNVQLGQNGVVSPPSYTVTSATVMPMAAPKAAYATTLPAVQYIQPGYQFFTPTNVWPYVIDPNIPNLTPMCFPAADMFSPHLAPTAAYSAVPAANVGYYAGNIRPQRPRRGSSGASYQRSNSGSSVQSQFDRSHQTLSSAGDAQQQQQVSGAAMASQQPPRFNRSRESSSAAAGGGSSASTGEQRVMTGSIQQQQQALPVVAGPAAGPAAAGPAQQPAQQSQQQHPHPAVTATPAAATAAATATAEHQHQQLPAPSSQRVSMTVNASPRSSGGGPAGGAVHHATRIITSSQAAAAAAVAMANHVHSPGSSAGGHAAFDLSLTHNTGSTSSGGPSQHQSAIVSVPPRSGRDYGPSSFQRRGGGGRGRRKQWNEDGVSSRQQSDSRKAMESTASFELEQHSFPPLPGAMSNASAVGDASSVDSKTMSDVVKGVSKLGVSSADAGARPVTAAAGSMVPVSHDAVTSSATPAVGASCNAAAVTQPNSRRVTRSTSTDGLTSSDTGDLSTVAAAIAHTDTSSLSSSTTAHSSVSAAASKQMPRLSYAQITQKNKEFAELASDRFPDDELSQTAPAVSKDAVAVAATQSSADPRPRAAADTVTADAGAPSRPAAATSAGYTHSQAGSAAPRHRSDDMRHRDYNGIAAAAAAAAPRPIQ